MSATSVSPAELKLLRRLSLVGGRATFRSDGASRLAYRVFEEGIVCVVLSLHAKQLLHIDTGATEVGGSPGEPALVAGVTAELTEAGRQIVEKPPLRR